MTAWGGHLSHDHDIENYTIKNRAVNQRTGSDMANSGTFSHSLQELGILFDLQKMEEPMMFCQKSVENTNKHV